MGFVADSTKPAHQTYVADTIFFSFRFGFSPSCRNLLWFYFLKAVDLKPFTIYERKTCNWKEIDDFVKTNKIQSGFMNYILH